MNPSIIEKAAQAAAPALEEQAMPGAVLRCAGGFTKRANSLNILSPQHGDSALLQNNCERFFNARGLPAVVRIPSFVQAAKFDAHLHAHGYQVVDPTMVLIHQLQQPVALFPGVQQPDIDQWLQYFYSMGNNSERLALHQLLLQKVDAKILTAAILNTQGSALACGLGVISEGLLGLYNIQTQQQCRQQGLGQRIVSSLLALAQQHGANGAYLQVVANNTPAVNLYKKLGFNSLYHYWYRIKTQIQEQQHEYH